MIDCPNVAVRDALPEYLHDALDPEHAAEIRAHLDGCSACTAEFAVMQAVMATTPRVPSIDTAKIVAAIPAYVPTYVPTYVPMAEVADAPLDQPMLRLESPTLAMPVAVPVAAPVVRAIGSKRAIFNSSKWRMAAGFLVAAIGVSALSITRHGGAVVDGEMQVPGVTSSVSSTVASSNQVASTAVSSGDADNTTEGLSIMSVSGLTDDQLAQLTRDLDQVEAAPLDEPESDVPAAIDVLVPGDGGL